MKERDPQLGLKQVLLGILIALVTASVTAGLNFVIQSRIERQTALMGLEFEIYKNTINSLGTSLASLEQKYVDALREQFSHFPEINHKDVSEGTMQTCLVSYERCFERLNEEFKIAQDAPLDTPLVTNTSSNPKVDELNLEITNLNSQVRSHSMKATEAIRDLVAIARCRAFNQVSLDIMESVQPDITLAEANFGLKYSDNPSLSECTGKEDVMIAKLTNWAYSFRRSISSELLDKFNSRYR